MNQTIKNKACAVVVTYNRLDMLRQCIAALKRQTAACDVLVVDNASTDGTGEWLAAQAAEDSSLRHHRSETNLGGAGGFHVGIRQAAEAGYAWIWVMDDDCIPEPHALERFLDADRKLQGAYGWLSSRALWTDGTPCLMNVQRATPYRDIAEFSAQLVPSVMASFVSLFLPAATVRDYGLPLKEFFIWTDDWEYTRRISRALPCYVATESTVVHAMKQNTVVDLSTDSPERLPRYAYAYRNDVYLYRREGVRGWLWLLAKDGYHTLRLLWSGHPGRIGIVWKGFWRGLFFRVGTKDGERR